MDEDEDEDEDEAVAVVVVVVAADAFPAVVVVVVVLLSLPSSTEYAICHLEEMQQIRSRVIEHSGRDTLPSSHRFTTCTASCCSLGVEYEGHVDMEYEIEGNTVNVNFSRNVRLNTVRLLSAASTAS